MTFILTFLEGIMAFLSPCTLPMLPVYLAYLSDGSRQVRSRFVNTVFFVLGFTRSFTAMGAGASVLGQFLFRHSALMVRLAGAVMVFFGLVYLDIIPVNIPGLSPRPGNGPLGSFVFGLAYAFGWTPCAGAFLGSTLALASVRPSAARGMLLLVTFSFGLGVPFILFSLFYEKLKDGILKKLREKGGILKTVGGAFLIIFGLLMLSGLFNSYLGIFS